MSIYHYFPSKEHLLDALVDRVIGSELTVLDPSAGPWRGQLEKSGAEWRAMALRHPHFFGYLALHRLNTPLALRWLNGVIGLLRSVGVGDERAVRMFRVMGYYLTGAMLDETQGYARGPSTVAPLSDEVMARDYPDVVAAGRWFQPDEWPGTYELGFRVFLDALERMVERRLL
jgi:AcrR family transcriptional regulator